MIHKKSKNMNLFHFLIDNGSRSPLQTQSCTSWKIAYTASGRCTIVPRGSPLSMIFSAYDSCFYLTNWLEFYIKNQTKTTLIQISLRPHKKFIAITTPHNYLYIFLSVQLASSKLENSPLRVLGLARSMPIIVFTIAAPSFSLWVLISTQWHPSGIINMWISSSSKSATSSPYFHKQSAFLRHMYLILS